ncbi:MAG: hypothetical protein OET90_05405, partial [Desulfuromonadales bacterium]|nr:hypothetical protein [Desulfuromonadales bacterium]
MKLRSKILFALIAVSVLPLIISLWVVGGKVNGKLEKELQDRARFSSIFIEQTTTKTSVENLQLIELIAASPLTVNAVYSAS